MINIGYVLLGIVVLFVPGFLLSFLLYAGSGKLDFWERLATSVGLSALIDMLIVTILAQPSISALRVFPVLGSILVFCGVCAVLLFFREESLRTFISFWGRSESD